MTTAPIKLDRLQGPLRPDTVSRLQDNVQRALDSVPASTKDLSATIVFTSAVITVPHPLGKAPRGLIVARKTVPGTVLVFCDVTFPNPQPPSIDTTKWAQLATNLSPAPTAANPLTIEGTWLA